MYIEVKKKESYGTLKGITFPVAVNQFYSKILRWHGSIFMKMVDYILQFAALYNNFCIFFKTYCNNVIKTGAGESCSS